MFAQFRKSQGYASLLHFRPHFWEFLRYALASAFALVLDFALLIGLTELGGWHYLVSAAVGFVAGSAFLYLLSIGFIFNHRRVQNRRAEFMVFAMIGVAGLLITQCLMFALVSLGGLAYPLAKMATVLVTFLFNFGMRKAMLFTSSVSAGA